MPEYYTLYYLSRLLDIGAPEKVRVALRPDRFRRWWHECYVPEVRVPALDRNWPRPQFFFCPLSWAAAPTCAGYRQKAGEAWICSALAFAASRLAGSLLLVESVSRLS